MSSDPAPCTRGDPWFQDGNIVLMPESGSKSEPQVAFKVHRGVLSRHSEVFQTMFEIPQPGKYVVDLSVTFCSLMQCEVSHRYWGNAGGLPGGPHVRPTTRTIKPY